MKNNPLLQLSEFYGWPDFQTYKAHLRLPKQYLRIIFKNYRNSLTEVPARLSEILTKYDIYVWNKMKQDATVEETYMRLAGIPSSFLRDDRIPDCKGDALKAYSHINRKITEFCGKGRLLYFYSLFQDNALLAACNIMKSAVKSKISSYTVSFPNLLAEIKTDWEKSSILKKCNEVDLLCLFMLGAEWKTDYTNSQLDALIQRRKLEKKTTILVSHLTEKEFEKRYDRELHATILKFEDSNQTETLKDIIRELGD